MAIIKPQGLIQNFKEASSLEEKRDIQKFTSVLYGTSALLGHCSKRKRHKNKAK